MSQNNIRNTRGLMLKGTMFTDVITHPGRKLRSLSRFPRTIWLPLNDSGEILKFAESLGYSYQQIGCPVIRRDKKMVQYQKYRLFDKNKISGYKKPWH